MSVDFVVGLTGGVGSGKTTVAEAFVRLGAGLVDTDHLARLVTGPGGRALPLLQQAFGAGILAVDGSLDRDAMRQRVFSDPESRKRLESILHPIIREEALAVIAGLQTPYVLLAIPLLVEIGVERYPLDRILVVDCPESVQVTRVMARSDLSAEEVRGIMAAQASRAERLAVADDVIDNGGAPDLISASVLRLHEDYLKRARYKIMQQKNL